MEAKVVSRGAGRSAVAASTYMSCSAIYNDYDGIQHDYTRKQGLVWQSVFLPDYAPAEWRDRAVLWNAVEAAEKTKDSRLAREFVVALPVELDRTQWQALLTEFIKEQFVSDGMCADVAIHDTDGHNPHAHILLTVRPLNKDGTWQHKTEKEYLCVKNGVEQGYTAAEFLTAQKDGWEKQYPYKVGKKRAYMPPSEAEKHGYERASKYPKSTKYGRQNPISQRWNSDGQLACWREAWAETSNRYLEQAGRTERIDHRSHADRGLEEQPTVHEGVEARAMERRGLIADRCELNRQIKADNTLLRELKAAMKKLAQTAKSTLPAIAQAMEKVRQKAIIFCYQLGHNRSSQQRAREYLSAARTAFAQYDKVNGKIRVVKAERKELAVQQNGTPGWNIPKKRQLSARITELTELLEELRSEKQMLLNNLGCADEKSVSAMKKEISAHLDGLKKLKTQEQNLNAELTEAVRQYENLQEQAAELDPLELSEARRALRPEEEQKTAKKLQAVYGEKYSPVRLLNSRNEAGRLLHEGAEERAVRERQREQRADRPRLKRRNDWER